MKENKENDFLKTNLTFGLVFRGDVETIQEIKEFLDQLDDGTVVYQTISGNKLFIEEEGGKNG